MPTKPLITAALFAAAGAAAGQVIYIPLGPFKMFPVQHFINVLSAVWLGPGWAVLTAFAISLLRNLFGTGSLIAFPGSMIGACLAGLLYHKTKKAGWAAVGEAFGTGVIGALAAYPVAKLLYGLDAAATYFILPFTLSTASGSVLAYAVLKAFHPVRRRFKADER